MIGWRRNNDCDILLVIFLICVHTSTYALYSYYVYFICLKWYLHTYIFSATEHFLCSYFIYHAFSINKRIDCLSVVGKVRLTRKLFWQIVENFCFKNRGIFIINEQKFNEFWFHSAEIWVSHFFMPIKNEFNETESKVH